MSKRRNKLKRVVVTATVYDKKGRILSTGQNSYTKTHPRMKELSERVNRPKHDLLHAEIAALIKVRHGTPYKIKVERYDKRGNPRMARPCDICMEGIRLAGIKFIEHTVG